jgi:hypothetical protein
MTGHEHILFEEAEVEYAPGHWLMLDARVYVDWWVSGGELHWNLGSWSAPEGKPIESDLLKPLTKHLNAYALRPKYKRYISDEIINRNGIVLAPNAEHRHFQRERA